MLTFPGFAIEAQGTDPGENEVPEAIRSSTGDPSHGWKEWGQEEGAWEWTGKGGYSYHF